MASISKVISKEIRCPTLPESYIRQESRRPRRSEVVNYSDDNPAFGGERDQIVGAFRSHSSFQVTDHGVSREVAEKKELGKAAWILMKMSSDNHSRTLGLPPSFDSLEEKAPTSHWTDRLDKPDPPTFKSLGEAICGGYGLSCSYGEKTFLPSFTCNPSTSQKREEFGSTLELSLGERVNKPAPMVESGNKKGKSVQSLPPTEKDEEEKNSKLGISLELSLLHEPWKIRKELSKSDLKTTYGLLIPKRDAEAYVMDFMDDESKKAIESEKGMGVIVEDMDTKTEHNLVFKYFPEFDCYILSAGWETEFVKRRELQEGDEVSLHWDFCSKKFNFFVLPRAVGDITFQLFGQKIHVSSDLIGCNNGEKNYMPGSILLSNSIPVSTSLKRKRSDSTPAPSVHSGQKMRTSAQLLLLEQEERRWEMRKKLSETDIGDSCRLLIPKKYATELIKCFMDSKNKEAIESKDGMKVIVVDRAKETEHNLVFKYWKTSKSYILNNGWKGEFVDKKGLKKDNVVVLYWDDVSKRFYFRVLPQEINGHPQA